MSVGSPRRGPTSTKIYGNKPKKGFILKPIGIRRSSPLDLYTMTLFFQTPDVGLLYSCVIFPTIEIKITDILIHWFLIKGKFNNQIKIVPA